MILSMSGQVWLFLSTVAAGFVIGLVYDFFRVLRIVVTHRQWLVQLEDVIYWVAVSLLMFYFMLHQNYGEIRFFIIIGAAIGVVIYFCSISPVFIKISVAVIEFLQRVIITVLRIILTPVRFLIRVLVPPVKCLARGGRRKLRYLKRRSTAAVRGFRRSLFVMFRKV